MEEQDKKEKSREEINSCLLQTLDIDRLAKFDHEISELFQTVFYSLSHNIDKGEGVDSGIVTHFLKNWKDTVGVSNISKTLPAIITGSIIEGACLSRLFHPSHEKSLELEADIMYIVGCIEKETAEQCFEDVDKTGFMKVKFSPDIQLFTSGNLPTIDDITEETRSEDSKYRYINGTELKVMHKNLQPNDRRLQFNHSQGTPHIVSLQQKISGPSSEIIFQTQPIKQKQNIDLVLTFLWKIKELLVERCDKFVEKFNTNLEQHLVLETVADAMVEGEKNRLCEKEGEKEKVWMSLDEAGDVMDQVNEKVELLDSSNKQMFDDYQELNSFLRSIGLICYQNRDKHFTETMNLYFDKSVGAYEEMSEAPKHNPLTQQVPDKSSMYSRASVASLTLTAININKMKHMPELIMKTKTNLKTKLKLLIDSVEAIAVPNGECETTDSISFDNVSCFYCPFWPNIASEWKNRKRCWPSPKHIESIINAGTFIVAKPSQEGENHALEWRWSFSSAEITLAKLRSHTMKYCYFIFKSLFYQYFKDFPGTKSMPSYVAKTCMLHLSEQHAEEWWCGAGITTAVLHLFKYLHQCLQEGFLAHYFINHLNLLEDIPNDVIQLASNMVSQILAKPSSYLKIDRGKLSTIEKLEGEVKMLYINIANESKENTRTAREYFQYITGLYQQRVYLSADCRRSNYFTKYYVLLSKQLMLSKLIEAQDKMLVDKRGTGPQYDIIDEYYKQNKAVLQQMEIEIKPLRENIRKTLKETAYIIKRFCIRCDLCMESIPCGENRYKCSAECDFDVCNSCHQEAANQPHKHTLRITDECSPYCYTQFTHERLGEEHLTEGIQINFKNVFEIRKKVKDLGLLMGYADKTMCSVFNYHGTIMNKELNQLFQALDHTTGKEDDNENSFVGTEGDPLEQLENYNSTYAEALQDTKNFVAVCEKRKLIEKIVYGNYIE